MIEHPVPQDITAYRFHLIGDMTLKQFLELAAGIILAWFIWTLRIPAFIRWPFIGLSALTGFALAFMPLEERSLDQWMLAFLKAVYNPTLFNWKKSRRSDFLDFTPRKTADAKPLDTVVKAPAAGLTTLLEAYNLQSQQDEKPDELEKDWLNRQNLIPSLFEEVEIPAKLAAETTFPKKLPPPAAGRQTLDTSYHLHPLLPPDNPAAVLRGEITLSPRIPKIPPTPVVSASGNQTPKPPQSQIIQHSEFNIQNSTPATKLPTLTPAPQLTTHNSQPAMASAKSMPSPPDHPNILAGMVLDPQGQIVPAAIIEIRDSSGLPVRAIKTNGLGQFTIATPLSPGIYELEIEKPGLAFDILKLEVKNEIIPPIEIRAKKEEISRS